MNYDSTTQFNEGNIVLYLSELEEYISYFIQYVANKRGDPHPAIAGVPLDKLTYKQPGGEKELHIDAPIDHEIVTEATHEDGSAAMDEKYYNHITSKDLYGTYQALY